MKTNEELRQEKYKKLFQEYDEKYAGNGYKKEFIPDAYFTQCNFGGLLMILSNSCDSVVVWSDWADQAVSDELTECEIVDEEGITGFVYQGVLYDLAECPRIQQEEEWKSQD